MAVNDRINGLLGSVAIKPPCRVATTANITLSGLQTIDGVTVVAGDRVLVKDQTTATENGIYEADTSAWSRAKDFNGNRDAVNGTFVLVTNGTANGESLWKVATANPITIGTSSIAFENALGSGLGASLVGLTQGGTVQDALKYVTPEMFDEASDELKIEAAYTYASANNMYVIIPNQTYTASPTIPWAPTVCYGFIDGLVTVNGSGTAFLGRMRAAAIKVEGPDDLWMAEGNYVDGSSFSGANGLNGIETQGVSRIVIGDIEIKNCGGTVAYKSGASFNCPDGELLQIGRCRISNCSYGGLDTAGTAGSTYAFTNVDIGSLIVEDCGGTSAGSNQYHSLYLSSCESARIGYFKVRNQANGYGIKVGSSTVKATGEVHIEVVDVNGIDDQGFITITEPCKSFTMGRGTVKAVKTYGLQAYYGDYISTGKVQFREDDVTGPKTNLLNEPAIRVRGSIGTLDISGSTFQGWLDGSTRRGILNAVSVDAGFTVSELVAVGTKYKLIRERILVVPATSIISMIQFANPTIDTCGGVFDIAASGITAGFIGDIYGTIGSFTSAWKVPARNAKLTVENVYLKAGGTEVRFNDCKGGRHVNVGDFNTANWIDSATGSAIAAAAGDMDYASTAIAAGFAGRVFDGTTWNNF